MYETIIMAVGNVIAGLFSGRFSKAKTANEQLMLQISEIQRTLDTELRKTNDSLNELHKNQTLQLFFETLKSLNIRISIGSPSNNVIFDFQSSPVKQDIDQALSIAAQNTLDFETIKTIFEIIGVSQNTVEAEIEGATSDIQFQNSPRTSTAQIMWKSKDRLRQRLEETKLK